VINNRPTFVVYFSACEVLKPKIAVPMRTMVAPSLSTANGLGATGQAGGSHGHSPDMFKMFHGDALSRERGISKGVKRLRIWVSVSRANKASEVPTTTTLNFR